MADLWKDNNADSMPILVIAATVLIFGIIYVLFTNLINAPIGILNEWIGQELVSQGSSDAFENIISLWQVTPFFVLVALILFSYERSKGTMIPAQVFFQYMVLMILGVLVSLLAIFGMGAIFDRILVSMSSITTDIGTWGSIATEWGSTPTQYYFSKLMYLVLALPAYICSILFIFHPLITQSETTETAFNSISGDEPVQYDPYEGNMKQF